MRCSQYISTLCGKSDHKKNFRPQNKRAPRSDRWSMSLLCLYFNQEYYKIFGYNKLTSGANGWWTKQSGKIVSCLKKTKWHIFIHPRRVIITFYFIPIQFLVVGITHEMRIGSDSFNKPNNRELKRKNIYILKW